MKAVEKTTYQILDEIEETWEEVKSDHRLEMSPQAIDWLINLSKKAEQFEDTLKYISGEARLTVDTLEEARQAASLVLEDADKQMKGMRR